MSHKPLGPKEFQLSPVHLLKIKKQVNNKSKNCLILSCETLRYPVKIQSWPYVEDYKLWFGDICNLVDNFNKNIKKNVVYRCGAPKDGFETSSQFKKKYPQSRISAHAYCIQRERRRSHSLTHILTYALLLYI